MALTYDQIIDTTVKLKTYERTKWTDKDIRKLITLYEKEEILEFDYRTKIRE